jgi:hypothetical protein
VFRGATFSSQAHLAWLTADAAALANDGYASLQGADLVRGAATAVTITFEGTTSVQGADPSLETAGVTTLVLWRTAHVVNAACLVIATHGAAD